MGTTSKKVQNPEELETQRFLVELEFPTVEVVFKD